MGNDLHYIIRAGACMRAYAVKMMEKHENGRQRRKRTGILLQALQVFLRFRYEKPTVLQRKTYGSATENIKTMETLHGFLPEVCRKISSK